jgi:hypothetical protein
MFNNLNLMSMNNLKVICKLYSIMVGAFLDMLVLGGSCISHRELTLEAWESSDQ